MDGEGFEFVGDRIVLDEDIAPCLVVVSALCGDERELGVSGAGELSCLCGCKEEGKS